MASNGFRHTHVVTKLSPKNDRSVLERTMKTIKGSLTKCVFQMTLLVKKVILHHSDGPGLLRKGGRR